MKTPASSLPDVRYGGVVNAVFTMREDGGPVVAPSTLTLNRARTLAKERARATAGTGRVWTVWTADGARVESYGGRGPGKARAVKVWP